MAELPTPGRGYPSFLHEPYRTTPPDLPNLQNTDPYVFGERFRYSNCRQNTKKGPLRTQRLATGSVILFGSGLDGEFVVDTVFVVADAQPLTADTVSEIRTIDEAFAAVTLELVYPSDGTTTFRLYDGATTDEPVHGIFSFFPCLPHEEPTQAFPRAVVQLDGVVNPRNWRACKMTRLTSLDGAHRIWEQVVEQVLDQDLALGVAADTPPFEEGTHTGNR